MITEHSVGTSTFIGNSMIVPNDTDLLEIKKKIGFIKRVDKG